MTWDMVHFDVQLIGGMVLHRGTIAEMATGEGKTLVATLPLYLNALTGRGVHLVTVNDYLARRDSEWMGQLYSFLGLTVGCIQHDQPPERAPRAVRCDITYGTNSEFGFDYLRDNGMATSREQQVQRALLRDRRRSGLGPHRRSPHAAHHLRPGHRRDASVRPLQAARRTARPQANACFATGSSTEAKELHEAGKKTKPAAALFKVKLGPAAQQGLIAHDGGSGAAQADREGGARVLRGH